MNLGKSLPSLKEAYLFGLKLDEQGVKGKAYDHAMKSFITQRIDAFCKCGEQLMAFQKMSGFCDKCREAYLQALEEKEKGGGDDPVETRMFRMGVVPRYRHCTLATWRGAMPHEDAVNDWILKPNREVVMWGPATGVGKTHLATAMLYALASANRVCYWITATELAQRIADEERLPSHPTLAKFERAGIAVLDDWGREVGAAIYAKEKVAVALENRHNWNRPTIVTMNMTPEQAELFDMRTWSRLRSGLVLTEFSGPDARLE